MGSIRNKVDIKVHHYARITSNSHIFAGKKVKNIGEDIFKKSNLICTRCLKIHILINKAYHLICKEQHRLQSEFSMTKIEQIFMTWA